MDAPKGKLYADGKLIGTEGKIVVPDFNAIRIAADMIQEEPAEIKQAADEPVKPKRAPRTHRFLHPTKGWRMFARHGKANRRRKLIRMGVISVPESHAFAHTFRKWTRDRRRLTKTRAEMSSSKWSKRVVQALDGAS